MKSVFYIAATVFFTLASIYVSVDMVCQFSGNKHVVKIEVGEASIQTTVYGHKHKIADHKRLIVESAR